MRKVNREVKDRNEIVEIIRKGRICHLCINDDVYPYIVPLNYGYEVIDDELYLYFHSAMEGRKIELLRNNNKVSFEIETDNYEKYDENKLMCTEYYESVIGQGEVFFIEEDKKRILDLIMNHYYPEGDKAYNLEVISRTLVYGLKVRIITGKRH
ncbi:MAG: pyridoxamine 5'-phosphate oxidase family protein [Erysipelotrichaceae bacterium]